MDVRDAGLYHLLFGVALMLLALGAGLTVGVATIAASVVAVGLVAVAWSATGPAGRSRQTLKGRSGDRSGRRPELGA